MKPTDTSRPCSVISGLLLALAVALGPVGCQEMVYVSPENGSIQQGPFSVQVSWSSGLVPSTLQVSINKKEITSSMSPTKLPTPTQMEVAGVMEVWLNPFPGRKLLSAQMNDANGAPYGDTSIFTATSTSPREGFAGGAMVFECTSSFLNSALQIPGFDLDLGFSEAVCNMLPISGVFPPGDSAFPVSSDPFPLLYGLFPQQVTFDADQTIPNGISLSPVALGLSFDFDPADPTQEGNVCGFSFVMTGTVLPVPPAISDQYHAAMVQSLREVSLSLVSGGECKQAFTSPTDVDIVTFNYAARK